MKRTNTNHLGAAVALVFLLTAASSVAHAGGDEFAPLLDADITNNQMVGMEPTGRVLTADDLAFDPILDADIYDPFLDGSSAEATVLTGDELVFWWIFDDEPVGAGPGSSWR